MKMKKILTTIAFTLLSFVLMAQTPYKILNKYVQQIWSGDTAKLYIYADSNVMSGTNPLHISYSDIYFKKLTLLNDTNIVFLDVNGKMQLATPAMIAGVGGTKWAITGSTLHPIDTTKNVAIGTNFDSPYTLYVDGDAYTKYDTEINGVMAGRGGGNINDNTRFGESALGSNTTGHYNSAFGELSLSENTKGLGNSAFGHYSMNASDSGLYNSGFGAGTLAMCNGTYNSAFGGSSMYVTTTGNYNSAFGGSSLTSNIGGSNIIALGYQAGHYQEYGNNRIYINSLDRHDSVSDREKSIIYGIQDATVSNQYLYLHANVHIGDHSTGYMLPYSDGLPGQTLTTDGAGTIGWGSGFDTSKCYGSINADTLKSCTDYLVLNDTLITPYLSGKTGINLLQVDSASGKIDSIATLNLATDTLPSLHAKIISTDTIFSSSGAIQINYKFTLEDEASLNLPSGSGFGQLKVDSVGIKKAAIYNATFDKNGSVDLVNKTSNVAATDTDTYFCVFDNGTYATIKNRLGLSVTCLMTIIYYE